MIQSHWVKAIKISTLFVDSIVVSGEGVVEGDTNSITPANLTQLEDFATIRRPSIELRPQAWLPSTSTYSFTTIGNQLIGYQESPPLRSRVRHSPNSCGTRQSRCSSNSSLPHSRQCKEAVSGPQTRQCHLSRRGRRCCTRERDL